MKNSVKKSTYLLMVLFCVTFVLPIENITNYSTLGKKQKHDNTGWWEVGDYYTYQEINNTNVNVTYTLTEEIMFNGTQVFNVSSTVSQRPLTTMWNETYQENNYHTVDSFERVGSQIQTTVYAYAYHQDYTSVENVTYLIYPTLAEYREGENDWRQKSQSHKTYQQLGYHEASGPFLWVFKQTDWERNSTTILETAEVTVSAGSYSAWKIESLYPEISSEYPYMSPELFFAQNSSSNLTITGDGIDWNPDSGSYENSSTYLMKIRNSTRINDSYTLMDYWIDDNGTVTSGNTEEFNWLRKVVYIDKTLGLVLKSMDYYWNSGQNRWEYFSGYELRNLYLASPPISTTTTASTGISTSTEESTTTSSSTTPSSSPFASLWFSLIILTGLYGKRKRKA